VIRSQAKKGAEGSEDEDRGCIVRFDKSLYGYLARTADEVPAVPREADMLNHVTGGYKPL
jgi:hypothetical protein